jgi:hypothetical protein
MQERPADGSGLASAIRIARLRADVHTAVATATGKGNPSPSAPDTMLSEPIFAGEPCVVGLDLAERDDDRAIDPHSAVHARSHQETRFQTFC